MWLFGKKQEKGRKGNPKPITGTLSLSHMELGLGIPLQVREFPGMVFVIRKVRYDGFVIDLPKALPIGKEIEMYLDTSFGNLNVAPKRFYGIVVSAVPGKEGFSTYVRFLHKTLEDQSEYYKLLILLLELSKGKGESSDRRRAV